MPSSFLILLILIDELSDDEVSLPIIKCFYLIFGHTLDD